MQLRGRGPIGMSVGLGPTALVAGGAAVGTAALGAETFTIGLVLGSIGAALTIARRQATFRTVAIIWGLVLIVGGTATGQRLAGEARQAGRDTTDQVAADLRETMPKTAAEVTDVVTRRGHDVVTVEMGDQLLIAFRGPDHSGRWKLPCSALKLLRIDDTLHVVAAHTSEDRVAPCETAANVT